MKRLIDDQTDWTGKRPGPHYLFCLTGRWPNAEETAAITQLAHDLKD